MSNDLLGLIADLAYIIVFAYAFFLSRGAVTQRRLDQAAVGYVVAALFQLASLGIDIADAPEDGVWPPIVSGFCLATTVALVYLTVQRANRTRGGAQ
jgi:hypothetical protein